MDIRVVMKDAGAVRDEVLVLGVPAGVPLGGMPAEVDRLSGGLLSAVMQQGDFLGKHAEQLLLYPATGLRVKRVLLVGLGKPEDLTPARLRDACAGAARHIRERGVARFSVPAVLWEQEKLPLPGQVRAIVEGGLLGLYRFDAYKTAGNGLKNISRMTIVCDSAADRSVVERAAGHAAVVAESVCLARDLVQQPANTATPRYLAGAARRLARQHSLRCTVYAQKQIAAMGMDAFLSVARGSDEPCRCIVLEYAPARKKKVPTIALVGKAITFDSGGISLKPAASMEEMKMDMAGGAAVLATVAACSRLRLGVRVVGIVPATENLPSGHALKPGDVVRSMSGRTIEIISTDAEGRLILADALTLAARYRPDAVVDLATLTGACVVALGNEMSAVLGTGQELIDALVRAGEAAGEPLWQLPLEGGYDELIKSDIADVKNSGGRPAGTITAGCFLKKFSSPDTPWAHIDIAGTAWTKKDRPCIPKGASGVGVRLLVQFLQDWNSPARES